MSHRRLSSFVMLLLGVAIFGGVAVVAASRLRSTSNTEAIRDAREWAALMAEEVMAPHVSEALLRHDRPAIDQPAQTARAAVRAERHCFLGTEFDP